MNTYKGLKIGDRVKTISPVYDYDKLIPVGTEFIIHKFTACTIPCKFTHFIYSNSGSMNIRAFPNEITKIK